MAILQKMCGFSTKYCCPTIWFQFIDFIQDFSLFIPNIACEPLLQPPNPTSNSNSKSSQMPIAYRGCKRLSSSMNLDSLTFSSYSSQSSRCRSASESVWRTNAVYWGCSDSSHFYASSVIIWHRRSRNVKAAIPPTIITLNSITKTTLLPNRVQTKFLHLIFIMPYFGLLPIIEVLSDLANFFLEF